MSSRKPWRPRLSNDADFNPFASPNQGSEASSTLRDPLEDTAPLQGTRDLSDADSLTDLGTGENADSPETRESRASPQESPPPK